MDVKQALLELQGAILNEFQQNYDFEEKDARPMTREEILTNVYYRLDDIIKSL